MSNIRATNIMPILVPPFAEQILDKSPDGFLVFILLILLLAKFKYILLVNRPNKTYIRSYYAKTCIK